MITKQVKQITIEYTDGTMDIPDGAYAVFLDHSGAMTRICINIHQLTPHEFVTMAGYIQENALNIVHDEEEHTLNEQNGVN